MATTSDALGADPELDVAREEPCEARRRSTQAPCDRPARLRVLTRCTACGKTGHHSVCFSHVAEIETGNTRHADCWLGADSVMAVVAVESL